MRTIILFFLFSNLLNAQLSKEVTHYVEQIEFLNDSINKFERIEFPDSNTTNLLKLYTQFLRKSATKEELIYIYASKSRYLRISALEFLVDKNYDKIFDIYNEVLDNHENYNSSKGCTLIDIYTSTIMLQRAYFQKTLINDSINFEEIISDERDNEPYETTNIIYDINDYFINPKTDWDESIYKKNIQKFENLTLSNDNSPIDNVLIVFFNNLDLIEKHSDRIAFFNKKHDFNIIEYIEKYKDDYKNY